MTRSAELKDITNSFMSQILSIINNSRRFVAAAVAVTFMVTQGPSSSLAISVPQSDSHSSTVTVTDHRVFSDSHRNGDCHSCVLENIASMQLPAHLGRIQENYQGKNDRTVILIQDAHAIPEAQRHIQQIIGHFQNQYGAGLVAVEGASQELEAQFFKSFPDQAKLKQVLESYFEKGELTGAAASAILNPALLRYQGIEDAALYEEGLRFYNKAMAQEKSLLQQVRAARKELQRQKKQSYSPPLLALDKKISDFHRERLSLTYLLVYLNQIQPPAPGTDLAVLIQTLQQEKTDPADQDRELREIAKNIKAYFIRQHSGSFEQGLSVWNQKYQEFQTGQISGREYALYLKTRLSETEGSQDQDENSSPFSLHRIRERLEKLSGDAQKIQDMQGPKIFEQLEAYILKIKTNLFRNEEEKKLDLQSHQLDLLEKLARLELSRKDWAEINLTPSPLTLGHSPLPLEGGEGKGEGAVSSAVAFYNNAEAREQAFLKNLMNLPSRQSRRGGFETRPYCLIAGGFHTEGLAQLLKEQQISYAVVMPSIKKIASDDFYRQHMQGQVSWKNYLKVENGQVDLYKAFARAVRDELVGTSTPSPLVLRHSPLPLPGGEGKGEGAAPLLKMWRDQIIRDLAIQKRTGEAEKYTGLIDELIREKEGASYLPQWQVNVERFLQKFRDLSTKRQLTVENVSKLLNPASILGALDGNYVLQHRSIPSDLIYPSGRSEVRKMKPEGETQDGVKSPEQIWQTLRRELESHDPGLAKKREGYLPRLYHALQRNMQGIQRQQKQGLIHPEIPLETFLYRTNPALLTPPDLGRPLRVGFLPVAGNPINWGHILIAMIAMNRLQLDTVIFRVQGEIKYKKVPESDKVSPENRHHLTEAVLQDFFPALRYTDVGLKDDHEGMEGMFEFSQGLNPNQDIKFFYIIGSESEKRTTSYMDLLYQQWKAFPNFSQTPNRSLEYVLMQRGEYGRQLTQKKAEVLMQAAAAKAGVPPSIPVHVVRGKDVDLNIASTYYREGGDDSIVPRKIHEFGVKHQRWGNVTDAAGRLRPRTEIFAEVLIPTARQIQSIILQTMKKKKRKDGLGIFAFDGPSGAGKTTVAGELDQFILKQGGLEEIARARGVEGYGSFVLELDFFLKHRKVRKRMEQYIAGEVKDPSGKIGTKTYLEENRFFRIKAILKLFREIQEFRRSGDEERTFVIKHPYIRRPSSDTSPLPKEYRFTLKKNTLLLVVGKYALDYQIPGFYDGAFRIQDEPGRNIALFQQRVRRLRPEDELRQIIFYDRALQPSYEAYAKRTAPFVDYEVDLTREMFEVRKNKLPPTSQAKIHQALKDTRFLYAYHVTTLPKNNGNGISFDEAIHTARAAWDQEAVLALQRLQALNPITLPGNLMIHPNTGEGFIILGDVSMGKSLTSSLIHGQEGWRLGSDDMIQVFFAGDQIVAGLDAGIPEAMRTLMVRDPNNYSSAYAVDDQPDYLPIFREGKPVRGIEKFVKVRNVFLLGGDIPAGMQAPAFLIPPSASFVLDRLDKRFQQVPITMLQWHPQLENSTPPVHQAIANHILDIAAGRPAENSLIQTISLPVRSEVRTAEKEFTMKAGQSQKIAAGINVKLTKVIPADKSEAAAGTSKAFDRAIMMIDTKQPIYTDAPFEEDEPENLNEEPQQLIASGQEIVAENYSEYAIGGNKEPAKNTIVTVIDIDEKSNEIKLSVQPAQKPRSKAPPRSEVRIAEPAPVIQAEINITRGNRTLNSEGEDYVISVAPLEKLSPADRRLMDRAFQPTYANGDYVVVSFENHPMMLGYMRRLEANELLPAHQHLLAAAAPRKAEMEADGKVFMPELLPGWYHYFEYRPFVTVPITPQLYQSVSLLIEGLLSHYYGEPVFTFLRGTGDSGALLNSSAEILETDPELKMRLDLMYDPNRLTPESRSEVRLPDRQAGTQASQGHNAKAVILALLLAGIGGGATLKGKENAARLKFQTSGVGDTEPSTKLIPVQTISSVLQKVKSAEGVGVEPLSPTGSLRYQLSPHTDAVSPSAQADYLTLGKGRLDLINSQSKINNKLNIVSVATKPTEIARGSSIGRSEVRLPDWQAGEKEPNGVLNLFEQGEILLTRDSSGSEIIENNERRNRAISGNDDRPENSSFSIDEMIAGLPDQPETGELKNPAQFLIRKGTNAAQEIDPNLKGNFAMLRGNEGRGNPVVSSRVTGYEPFFFQDGLQRSHAGAFFQKKPDSLLQPAQGFRDTIAATGNFQFGAKTHERATFFEDEGSKSNFLHNDKNITQALPQKQGRQLGFFRSEVRAIDLKPKIKQAEKIFFDDEKAQISQHLKTGIEEIRKQVLPGSPFSLLDLGTGQGELTSLIADRFIAITAVDKDASRLANARFLLPSTTKFFIREFLPLLKGDLRDKRFHVILMSHVFLFIPRQERNELLAEALRHLEPGGKLVFVLNANRDQPMNQIQLQRRLKKAHQTAQFSDPHSLENTIKRMGAPFTTQSMRRAYRTKDRLEMISWAAALLPAENRSFDRMAEYIDDHHYDETNKGYLFFIDEDMIWVSRPEGEIRAAIPSQQPFSRRHRSEARSTGGSTGSPSRAESRDSGLSPERPMSRGEVRVAGAANAKLKILFADKPGKADALMVFASQHAGEVEILEKYTGIGTGPDALNALKQVFETEHPDVVFIRSGSDLKDRALLQALVFGRENSLPPVILRGGADTDNVNLEAAKELGIVVSRAHGSQNSVANLFLRFLLAYFEKIQPGIFEKVSDSASDLSKTQGWKDFLDLEPEQFSAGLESSQKNKRGQLTPEQTAFLFSALRISEGQQSQLKAVLENTRLAFLGFGAIPIQIAEKQNQMAERMQTKTAMMALSRSLEDPSLDQGAAQNQAKQLGIEIATKQYILETANVISVHLPGKVKNYLGAPEFQILAKREGLVALINTSREANVDHEALRTALRAKTDLYYFADIDLIKKGVPVEILVSLANEFPDQVFLVPHIGASTPDATAAVEAQTLLSFQELFEVFSGQKEFPEAQLDYVVPYSPRSEVRTENADALITQLTGLDQQLGQAFVQQDWQQVRQLLEQVPKDAAQVENEEVKRLRLRMQAYRAGVLLFPYLRRPDASQPQTPPDPETVLSHFAEALPLIPPLLAEGAPIQPGFQDELRFLISQIISALAQTHRITEEKARAYLLDPNARLPKGSTARLLLGITMSDLVGFIRAHQETMAGIYSSEEIQSYLIRAFAYTALALSAGHEDWENFEQEKGMLAYYLRFVLSMFAEGAGELDKLPPPEDVAGIAALLSPGSVHLPVEMSGGFEAQLPAAAVEGVKAVQNLAIQLGLSKAAEGIQALIHSIENQQPFIMVSGTDPYSNLHELDAQIEAFQSEAEQAAPEQLPLIMLKMDVFYQVMMKQWQDSPMTEDVGERAALLLEIRTQIWEKIALKEVPEAIAQKVLVPINRGIEKVTPRETLEKVREHLRAIHNFSAEAFPLETQQFQAEYDRLDALLVQMADQPTYRQDQLLEIQEAMGDYLQTANEVIGPLELPEAEEAQWRRLAQAVVMDYEHTLPELYPRYFRIHQPGKSYLFVGIWDSKDQVYPATSELGVFGQIFDAAHTIAFRNEEDLIRQAQRQNFRLLVVPLKENPQETYQPEQVKWLPVDGMNTSIQMNMQNAETGEVLSTMEKGGAEYQQRLDQMRQSAFEELAVHSNPALLESLGKGLESLGWQPSEETKSRWLLVEPDRSALAHYLALHGEDIVVISSDPEVVEALLRPEVKLWTHLEGSRLHLIQGTLEAADMDMLMAAEQPFDFIVLPRFDRNNLANAFRWTQDWKRPGSGGWYLGVAGGETEAEVEQTQQLLEPLFTGVVQNDFRISRHAALDAAAPDHLGLWVQWISRSGPKSVFQALPAEPVVPRSEVRREIKGGGGDVSAGNNQRGLRPMKEQLLRLQLRPGTWIQSPLTQRPITKKSTALIASTSLTSKGYSVKNLWANAAPKIRETAFSMRRWIKSFLDGVIKVTGFMGDRVIEYFNKVNNNFNKKHILKTGPWGFEQGLILAPIRSGRIPMDSALRDDHDDRRSEVRTDETPEAQPAESVTLNPPQDLEAAKNFPREIALIEGAKETLFQQLVPAFQKGVFYGSTRISLGESLLEDAGKKKMVTFDVDFERGHLQVGAGEENPEVFPLLLNGVVLGPGASVPPTVSYDSVSVQNAAGAAIPLLDFVSRTAIQSSYFKFTGKENLFKVEKLRAVLDKAETQGEIHQAGNNAVSSVRIPEKRLAVLHLNEDSEYGFVAYSVYQMSPPSDIPEDALKWHIHRNAHNDWVSYVDVKGWKGDKTEMIVTEVKPGESYKLSLFRPKSANAAQEAGQAYEAMAALLGPTALQDRSIVQTYFHVTQMMLTRSEIRALEAQDLEVANYFSSAQKEKDREALALIPEDLREAFLSATELIGLLSRQPEYARNARQYLKENPHVIKQLAGFAKSRLSGQSAALPERLKRRLLAADQQALMVIFDAIQDSNLLSPLKTLEQLPLAIHFDAGKLENYFSKEKQYLIPPLPGEVSVTDLWFIYDPSSILALVATHREEGLPPHNKGGIRFIDPGKPYNHQQIYHALFGKGNDEGVMRDLFDLVRAQDPKNLLGTEFQGAKAEYTIMPGADDAEAFKKFGAVLLDAGILDHVVPGPDIGMPGNKVQSGVEEARRMVYQHLRFELGSLRFMPHWPGFWSWWPVSKKFTDFSNPLFFYEATLQRIEHDNPPVKFLHGRILRLIRMEMVRDYLQDVLPQVLDTDTKVFETTDALEQAFYEEIRRRVQGLPAANSLIRADYDPERSESLRQAIDKILGAVITGGDPDKGAIDHVEAAVTGKGVDTGLQRVKDYLRVKRYAIDGVPINEKTRFRIAVNGAGDVGGSTALMAARRGDWVVAINDKFGVVYRPEGFSVEDLQYFNTIPPTERNVVKFFGSMDGVQVDTNKGKLFNGEMKFDILVTAARANTIHEDNIGNLQKAGVLAVVEGGNNTYKRVADPLHAMGIVTAWGSTINMGGVIASSHENQAKHRGSAADLTLPKIKNLRTGEEFPIAPDHFYETVYLTRRMLMTEDDDEHAYDHTTTVHLRNGRVWRDPEEFHAGNIFNPDLPDHTLVDIQSLNGKTIALMNNFEIGDVVRLETIAEVIIEGQAFLIHTNDGKVSKALGNPGQFKPDDPVEIVSPKRQRKYETYRFVEKSIAAYTTLVLALQEPKNPERDPIHVQQAISRLIGEKKRGIFLASEGPYVAARQQALAALKAQGYLAAPEEMMHLVAADIARAELFKEQKDGSILTIHPYTRQPIRVTQDFQVVDLEQNPVRAELRDQIHALKMTPEEVVEARQVTFLGFHRKLLGVFSDYQKAKAAKADTETRRKLREAARSSKFLEPYLDEIRGANITERGHLGFLNRFRHSQESKDRDWLTEEGQTLYGDIATYTQYFISAYQTYQASTSTAAQKQEAFKKLESLNAGVMNLLKRRLKIQLIRLQNELEAPAIHQATVFTLLMSINDIYHRLAYEHYWRSLRRGETNKAYVRFQAVDPAGYITQTLDYERQPLLRIETSTAGRVNVSQILWREVEVEGGRKALQPVMTPLHFEDFLTAYRSREHALESQQVDYTQLKYHDFALQGIVDVLAWYEKNHESFPEDIRASWLATLESVLQGPNGQKGLRRKIKRLVAARGEVIPMPKDSLGLAQKEIQNGKLKQARQAIENARLWIKARREDIESSTVPATKRKRDYLYLLIRDDAVFSALNELQNFVSRQKVPSLKEITDLLERFEAVDQTYFRVPVPQIGGQEIRHFHQLQKELHFFFGIVRGLRSSLAVSSPKMALGTLQGLAKNSRLPTILTQIRSDIARRRQFLTRSEMRVFPSGKDVRALFDELQADNTRRTAFQKLKALAFHEPEALSKWLPWYFGKTDPLDNDLTELAHIIAAKNPMWIARAVTQALGRSSAAENILISMDLRRDPKTVVPVVWALGNEDAVIRTSAEKILMNFGRRDIATSAPPIVGALSRGNQRDAAERILIQIGTTDKDFAREIMFSLAAALRDPDPAVLAAIKKIAVVMLGKVNPADAKAVAHPLRYALKDPQRRPHAEEILTQIGLMDTQASAATRSEVREIEKINGGDVFGGDAAETDPSLTTDFSKHLGNADPHVLPTARGFPGFFSLATKDAVDLQSTGGFVYRLSFESLGEDPYKTGGNFRKQKLSRMEEVNQIINGAVAPDAAQFFVAGSDMFFGLPALGPEISLLWPGTDEQGEADNLMHLSRFPVLQRRLLYDVKGDTYIFGNFPYAFFTIKGDDPREDSEWVDSPAPFEAAPLMDAGHRSETRMEASAAKTGFELDPAWDREAIRKTNREYLETHGWWNPGLESLGYEIPFFLEDEKTPQFLERLLTMMKLKEAEGKRMVAGLAKLVEHLKGLQGSGADSLQADEHEPGDKSRAATHEPKSHEEVVGENIVSIAHLVQFMYFLSQNETQNASHAYTAAHTHPKSSFGPLRGDIPLSDLLYMFGFEIYMAGNIDPRRARTLLEWALRLFNEKEERIVHDPSDFAPPLALLRRLDNNDPLDMLETFLEIRHGNSSRNIEQMSHSDNPIAEGLRQHFQNTKDATLQAARLTQKPGTAVVLGSGRFVVLPLAAMLKDQIQPGTPRFSKIVLVEMGQSLSKRALEDLRKAGQITDEEFQRVEIVRADATLLLQGLTRKIDELMDEARKTADPKDVFAVSLKQWFEELQHPEELKKYVQPVEERLFPEGSVQFIVNAMALQDFASPIKEYIKIMLMILGINKAIHEVLESWESGKLIPGITQIINEEAARILADEGIYFLADTLGLEAPPSKPGEPNPVHPFYKAGHLKEFVSPELPLTLAAENTWHRPVNDPTSLARFIIQSTAWVKQPRSELRTAAAGKKYSAEITLPADTTSRSELRMKSKPHVLMVVDKAKQRVEQLIRELEDSTIGAPANRPRIEELLKEATQTVQPAAAWRILKANELVEILKEIGQELHSVGGPADSFRKSVRKLKTDIEAGLPKKEKKPGPKPKKPDSRAEARGTGDPFSIKKFAVLALSQPDVLDRQITALQDPIGEAVLPLVWALEHPDTREDAEIILTALGRQSPGIVVRKLVTGLSKPLQRESVEKILVLIGNGNAENFRVLAPSLAGGALRDLKSQAAAERIFIRLGTEDALMAKIVANALVKTLSDRGVKTSAEKILIEIGDLFTYEIASVSTRFIAEPERKDSAERILTQLAEKNAWDAARPLVAALQDSKREDSARKILVKIARQHPSEVTSLLVLALGDTLQRERAEIVMKVIIFENNRMQRIIEEEIRQASRKHKIPTEIAAATLASLARVGNRSVTPQADRSEIRELAGQVVDGFRNEFIGLDPQDLARQIVAADAAAFVAAVETEARRHIRLDMQNAEQGFATVLDKINQPTLIRMELSAAQVEAMQKEHSLQRFISTLTGAVRANKFVLVRLQTSSTIYEGGIRGLLAKKSNKDPVSFKSAGEDLILYHEAMDQKMDVVNVKPMLTVAANFDRATGAQLDGAHYQNGPEIETKNMAEVFTAALLWVADSLSKQTAELIARDASQEAWYHITSPAALGALAHIGNWLAATRISSIAA